MQEKERKPRVSLTIEQPLLDWINQEIKTKRFASQSHAVEQCLAAVKNRDYSKGLSLDVIESDPQLRSVAPFFHFEQVFEDKIFLKDDSANQTVTLQIKNKQLYCDLDRTTNCVHIGFAWAIDKVRAVLRDRIRR